jgi:hypothetical protein
LLVLSLLIHEIIEKVKGPDYDFYSNPLVMMLSGIPTVCALTIALLLVIYHKIYWAGFVFIFFFCFGFLLYKIFSLFKAPDRESNNREFKEPDERDLEAY